MTVRSPHLYSALRSFCLAAFAALAPEAARNEIPFVVDERGGLYEYRPLVRDHLEARASSLARLPDAQIAVDELRREPAAAIFARGAAGDPAGDRALLTAVLLPLLVATAEACGGFDWEDGAFNRVYGELEQSLFGTSRAYAVAAPLVGLSIGTTVELSSGIHVRRADPDELAGFGVEPEPSCVLAFARRLETGDATLPDAPDELARAVSALRLATGAAIAAGPILLERLDRHPLGMRAMSTIAATEPGGEATRLDPWRGRLAGDLLEALGGETDAALAESVELWELGLFEGEPLRSERLRGALAALLGGADGLWAAAMRAAMLVGETGDARKGVVDGLRRLARGDAADDDTAETVRRVLVEVLLDDDRQRLLAALDEALLGLRARPPGYFAARASAA